MTPDQHAALADPPVEFDDLLDDMEPAREEPQDQPAPSESSFLDTDMSAFEPEFAPEHDPLLPDFSRDIHAGRVDFEPEFEPQPVALEPEPVDAPESADGVRTYRGAALEEILPRIRTELGPDAVVLRQREGLMGGVGGFFQRRCVEVEARAGGPRIDLYDSAPAAPEPEPFVPEPPASAQPTPEAPAPQPFAPGPHSFVPAPKPPVAPPTPQQEGFASPAIEQLVRQAQPFAEQLTAAQAEVEVAAPEAPAGEAAVPGAVSIVATPGERPAKAHAVERKLAEAGIGSGLAAEIVGAAVSHRLPFAGGGRLTTVVRDALARRIPVEEPSQAAGRTIAVVGAAGAGKTAAVAAIASAYAAGSDLPVICLTLAPRDRGESLAAALRGTTVQPVAVPGGKQAAALIAEARGRALVVVDTPSLSPADAKAVTALRRNLRAIGDVEVHLALRAAVSRPAAGEQASSFAALGASRIVLTHSAETSHLGPVVDLAIAESLPLSFVSEGPGAVAPADAAELARRMLA